jgi:ubiquinone/menaquinone biosynthesis C-methylase UbiE
VISSSDSVAAAFDAIADDYDAQLSQNPVATYMRSRLHALFRATFPSGSRLLDLAAGTGIDAIFLASIGCKVIAVDASHGMLTVLENKFKMRGLTVETHELAVENLGRLGVTGLDGVISTFGGLNTVGATAGLAEDLCRALKPHGRLILHALSRYCLWHTLRSAAHGRLSFERPPDIHVGPGMITQCYFSPLELWREEFAKDFVQRHAYAMSVVAAPSLVIRFPRAAPFLFALDTVAGRLFPNVGDFFVLDLEKRDD